MELYRLERGPGPLLVNVPHSGIHVPDHICADFAAPVLDLPDTDWFVDELYAGVTALGAGMMVATHSRYVVDLNRPPDNSSLYATRGTGLVPLETFSGQPIYRPGCVPDEAETHNRVSTYWTPYHQTLASELESIRRRHGFAVLLDGHSIQGEVPALFEGVLPDLNLGSYRGQSAAPILIHAAMDVLDSAGDWSSVLDGRFQGGYNTRHYGVPDQGIHALQLEMSQRIYMQEFPPDRNPSGMQHLARLLERLAETLLTTPPDGHAGQ